MTCQDCRYYNPTGDKQGKCERMSDEDFDMLVYADDDSTCPKFEVKSNALRVECALGALKAIPKGGQIKPHLLQGWVYEDSWESVSK